MSPPPIFMVNAFHYYHHSNHHHHHVIPQWRSIPSICCNSHNNNNRIYIRHPSIIWRPKSQQRVSSSMTPILSSSSSSSSSFNKQDQLENELMDTSVSPSLSKSSKPFTTATTTTTTTTGTTPHFLNESGNMSSELETTVVNNRKSKHHRYRKPRRTIKSPKLRCSQSDIPPSQQPSPPLPPPPQQQQQQYKQEVQYDSYTNRLDLTEPVQPSVSTTPVRSSDHEVSVLMMEIQMMVANHPRPAHDVLKYLLQVHGKIMSQLEIVTCYATVMDAYIQMEQLHDAQNILDEMEAAISNQDSLVIIPSTITSILDHMYVSMTQAWANDSKDDFTGTSAEHAERILRRVMLVIRTHDDEVIKNENERTNRRVDVDHRDSRSRNLRKKQTRTETVLHTQQSICSNNAIVKIWTIVVDGWSKRAGIVPSAMVRADQLLLEMETHVHSFIRPNVLTYTSVICGLSRCKQNDLARMAEDVLERMKQNNIWPDMVAYAAVINCWAKAVSRRERGIAAKRAIGLLNEMEHLYITKKMYNVKPSTLTYITVIAAIGNSIDPDAAQLAEGIIHRMRNLHESGTILNVKPNTATYNAVIFALGRGPISKRNHPTAVRAEKLLDDMTQRVKLGEWDMQPDVRTWAFVLRAWARSKQPDAAEQAQRVLDQMEQLYKTGMSNVRPNFVCYTTVMGAWGYSRSKNALENMENILKRMEDQYTQTLEPDVRPNTVSYVTCIDAFVGRNEPDAAQRAQATVDRMMKLYAKGLGHVRPTRPVFDVLIQAWSRSKEKNAAQNAEKIFHWMENQYNQSGDTLVRPNEITLCAVLNAWANQAENGGAARALQIWEHINAVATQRDSGFRSTIAMANVVIKAIARSKDPDAVIKAERVLLKLEDDYRSGKSYVRPDVTTYSSVINACAYCVGNAAKRSEALQTALRTFYKLYNMKEENANNITYGTVLKAIQNLMPISEERIELVRQIFDMCCEDGCVDYFVLSQVRFASPQLYRDLVEGPCGLGGPGLKYGLDAVLKNVPTEWTANTLD